MTAPNEASNLGRIQAAAALVVLLGLGAACGTEAGAPSDPMKTPDASSDGDPMSNRDPNDDRDPGTDGESGGEMQPGDMTGQHPITAEAQKAFRDAFRQGRYEAIGEVVTKLEAAVEEDGENARTYGYLGYLYTWRVSESARRTTPVNPIADLAGARMAFERAVALAPSDARLLGFMASMAISEGRATSDPALVEAGTEAMAQAVEASPEFNLFTASYTESLAPFDSPGFAGAVEQLWDGLEICLGFALDRSNPDQPAGSGGQAMPSTSSACQETGLSPHNLKGYMLNMGDMIVKSGDWQVAQKIYAFARASTTYDAWPLHTILEDRIANAQSNVAKFRAAGFGGDPVETMMFTSRFSCMGCHENKE